MECFYEDYRQTPTNKLNARIGELQALLDSYQDLLAQGGGNLSSLPPLSAHDQSIGPTTTRMPLSSMQTNGGVNGYSAPGAMNGSNHRTNYPDVGKQSSWGPTSNPSSFYPGIRFLVPHRVTVFDKTYSHVGLVFFFSFRCHSINTRSRNRRISLGICHLPSGTRRRILNTRCESNEWRHTPSWC